MSLLAVVRSLMVTAWFLVHTMICAVTLLIGALFLPMPWFADLVIRTLWARPVLWLGGFDVEVRGVENWPRDGGFLVTFNHTSWIDILVMVACLPRVPRFGAKIELFRIPFFGRAMRRSGMLPIERSARARVLQVYKDAEDRARAGECFALAPEGTRQVARVLGRFKQGPFLFAIGAGVPLVPLVISGAQDVMPKTSWLINANRGRPKVILSILPAIETNGYTNDRIGELQDRLRHVMQVEYEKLNRELEPQYTSRTSRIRGAES